MSTVKRGRGQRKNRRLKNGPANSLNKEARSRAFCTQLYASYWTATVITVAA